MPASFNQLGFIVAVLDLQDEGFEQGLQAMLAAG